MGASAGGLKPLEAFFNTAPPSAGWCFVVIQHLSPDYRSMMKNLLERQFHFRIQQVQDGLRIEPNTIYLNKPSEFVKLENDRFRTRAYDEADGLPHLPIDYFFNSLCGRDPAATFGAVLSGSGSDGTRGAMALHATGATIMAQSPDDAEFSSMPQSVLKSGAVDRILLPSEMPKAVEDFLEYGKDAPEDMGGRDPRPPIEIQEILKSQTDIDFSNYKPDLLARRIERRQQLHGFRDLEEYRQLLLNNPIALDELYQDILIGVTQFYRNPEAITALRKEALDAIVRDKSGGDPVRIWVPACASGEEAYTIAIELNEAIKAAQADCKFRVIATDVHRRSIDRASAGIYSEEAMTKMPVALRDRYFDRHRDHYIVEPTLRQKIIFSVHDALSDPPFMHLDLISCRNFLIYLKPEARTRIVSMFLFGLRRDGYMLLGPSESLGPLADEFATVNQRWRLYRKTSDGHALNRYHLPDRKTPRAGEHYAPVLAGNRNVARTATGDAIELRNRDMLIKSYNALLKRYAPSSILISSDGRVLSWFGAASAFIDTMNNLADWTVEDIVHPALHFAINVGMEKMRRQHPETYTRRVKVEFDRDHVQHCTVSIEPLEQAMPPRFLLVSLRLMETTPQTDEETVAGPVATDDDGAILSKRIVELERDLRLTEETLQQVTERLEASGEELQASNEELQASNEELQASNEELQSSNEELHAVNEELTTVSAEHELKIEELSDLNENMDLVLRLLNVGVIILDGDGTIRRYSRLIGQVFKMQQHDIGRTLEVVGPRFDFVDLWKMAEETIENGTAGHAAGEHEGHRISVGAHPVPPSDEDCDKNGAVLIFHGFDQPEAVPAAPVS
ncbi:sensory transduction histidine kinase [Pseudooceanicola batsensis HTCC2597]|uniref:protein-glutamate O-methyltransferase n=1 Tax=Pseudooceanicola batsensis (strain ATCC BAA-863 / DSM 15984 / KCTC 12145 / HTCC2597) TaxID=252305 RepID=A3TUA0_PSEBH|nr:sensory transduction histidine kinase [Pseudooceanicola batsensis HTCC2597]